MHHVHLLGSAPHVGLLSVKHSLHHQSVQDLVNVSHLSPPVPHPPSHLHLGKPDEVPKVEVIGLVVVPVLPLLANPLDQRVSTGVGVCIHGCAVGRVGTCHPGHARDGVLAIATRHIVVVKIIARHDELGG